jgi:hypothetical protein
LVNKNPFSPKAAENIPKTMKTKSFRKVELNLIRASLQGKAQ